MTGTSIELPASEFNYYVESGSRRAPADAGSPRTSTRLRAARTPDARPSLPTLANGSSGNLVDAPGPGNPITQGTGRAARPAGRAHVRRRTWRDASVSPSRSNQTCRSMHSMHPRDISDGRREPVRAGCRRGLRLRQQSDHEQLRARLRARQPEADGDRALRPAAVSTRTRDERLDTTRRGLPDQRPVYQGHEHHRVLRPPHRGWRRLRSPRPFSAIPRRDGVRPRRRSWTTGHGS